MQFLMIGILLLVVFVIGMVIGRWVLGIYLLHSELKKINANIERLCQLADTK